MKTKTISNFLIFLMLIICWAFPTTYCCGQSQGAAINTTGASADPSAVLDVSSTAQGMLVPRLALTGTSSQSPITATPANSLLVYNTASTGDVTPGYYYWNGSVWVRLNSGSAVTNVGTGAGLAGGPITSTGTISLANGTAAGQTYVTGASSPYTPALVPVSGDATISSAGAVKVNALESATTSVNVSAATAPTSGQVLTATSPTAATWQTPAGGSQGHSLLAIRVLTSTTSNTTYTPTTGTARIIIYLIGGGGGGAGVPSGGSWAGGGGGAGNYLIKFINNFSGTATYQCGAGGTGGTPWAGSGLSTSFTYSGTTYTANGGNGGTGQSNPGQGGGNGSISTLGDINGYGMPGLNSGYMSLNAQWGGSGGSSYFGGAGIGTYNTQTGQSATGYGSGGAGAGEYNTNLANGGAGAQGVIIVYEYN